MPLHFSDAQLDAIMRLARPLEPTQRDVFLQLLGHALADRRDVGDGELHRSAVEIIRNNRLFDAPNLAGAENSKYR
jgi:hypothetical protein